MASREAAAKREREKSADVRDIGEIPRAVNPKRKKKCRASLELFLLTYFPVTFAIPFSDDQRSVIAKTQGVVIDGGLHAVGMPRGSGKTSIAEGSVLYAILYGFRKFVMFIGAARDAAVESLESIKRELEDNELLLADFPEAVFPIHCLEGEPRRCKGQTYKGTRTHSRWGQDEVVMPMIPRSLASGAVIRVAGITGRIRGQKHKRPDGVTQRPDLVLPDDIQTDDSALSQMQCDRRERTLAGAVLGLAGPKKKISGIAPMTVIRAGDVADRLLDPKIHPEWNGSRHRMLYEWPTNMDLWLRYKEIYLSFNPMVKNDNKRAASDATEFYRANREAMDLGGRVAWVDRFNEDEISGLQHAINFWIRDPRAFAAEGQGEPLPEEKIVSKLTADEIAGKVNGAPRWHLPLSATLLTAFIDVQKDVLFYVVMGWEPNFTGYVVDYGAYPDQGRPYFVLTDIDRTIAWATKVDGLEGQLHAGLTNATNVILGKEYSRGSGSTLRIERCLIDANWGESTNIVYQFCRQSPHAAVLMPSHGKGIGASASPMASWHPKPGEKRDKHGMWIVSQAPQRREIRYFVYDTNAWKSFVQARLCVAMGNPGCMSMFGTPGDLAAIAGHRMFADHLTAEYPVLTAAKGREVDEWKLKPNRDNHWWDCLVGATAAASMQGAMLAELKQPTNEKKGRKSWASGAAGAAKS